MLSTTANNNAATETSMGITTTRAKYTQYGSYRSRLSTFRDMRSNIIQSKEILAHAGFFYTGTGDLVRCFYCGGGLRNWDRSDDPWTEHKRWFPKCDFLNKFSDREQIKSENNVSAQYERSLKLPIYIGQDIGESGENAVTLDLENTNLDFIIAAKAVLHLGYNRSDVRNALELCSKETKTHVTALQLLTKILQLKHILVSDSEDSSNGSQTQENDDSFIEIERENVDLKEKFFCKMCQRTSAEVAFLPCGHLVTCKDCGPAVKYCIVCKTLVKATVKVFMS
ncbi:BIRC7_8 [Mytilus coruscus]|uniref:BIRC7_8 n=1 Tax=Mytilus coruscus TaxID=42192 RepID=A0A6J8CMR2_MYTCO|nr:BIRC7_8 [Mytilus coruscus]